MSFLICDPTSSHGSSDPGSYASTDALGRGGERRLFETLFRTASPAFDGPSPSPSSPAAASRSAGGLPSPVHQALRDLALLHRGQPMELERVAEELVRTVLQTQIPKRRYDSREWRVMSRRIAQTMLDDPTARERLQAFWRRLTETKR